MLSLVERDVLLTSWALGAGWSRGALFRRLAAEEWTRVGGGAWAPPGRPIDDGVRLRALQLLNPHLVVSHRSAAELWWIETLDSSTERPLEFTDPELGLRRAGTGVRVHRIPLAEHDIVERHGFRITTVPRTLADLLRTAPRDDAIVAVESALTHRRFGQTRRAPLTRLDAIASALDLPHRGAVRARHRLRLCDPHAGSPAETIARLRMYDAGLHPESQVTLRTPNGRRVVLDFLFRAEGLAIEIEGYAYHGTREAHRRDVTRFNQLHQCPEVRSLLRYTAEDVFHRPAHMLTEIQTTLTSSKNSRP